MAPGGPLLSPVPSLGQLSLLRLLPLLPWLLGLALPAPSLASRSLYDLAAVDIDGHLVSLSKYRGTVSLVVNVASFCGLTKANYEQLALLQQQLGAGGRFQVLAFPCNQFNSQEPKSNGEIKKFAQRGYGATFPLFAKSTVNSPMCQGAADSCEAESEQCCPTNSIIYSFLKSYFNDPIEWNFQKFLIDDQGVPIQRYPPTTNPVDIMPDIQRALRNAVGSGVSGIDEQSRLIHDTL